MSLNPKRGVPATGAIEAITPLSGEAFKIKYNNKYQQYEV